MTSSPPDPLPSDEAVEAAYAGLAGLGDSYIGIQRALIAAYAIDMPRREAEVRAEHLRRIVNWLQARAEDQHNSDTTYHMAVKDAAAYLLWEFNEGDPDRSMLQWAAEVRAHERQRYDDFIEGLTAKLNAAGVPAMPSWADAIDWVIERAESGRAEVRAETVREVLRWLRRPQGMGGDSIRRMGDANAIAKEFGIDGDVSL